MPDVVGQYDASNADTPSINITPAMQQQMLARANALIAKGDYASAGKALPPDYTIDGKSGQVRPKTWWERNGETTKFLLGAAASLAGGYYLQGLQGAQAADAARQATTTGQTLGESSWSGVEPATTAAPTAAPLASTQLGSGAVPAVAGSVAAPASSWAPATASMLASTPGLFSSPLVTQQLVSTLGGVIGNIYAANTQASSSTDAANIQAKALSDAAQIQAGSSREALDFQKQQAALAAYNANQTQQANYNLYKAQEQRLTPLNELLGLGPRQVPDYVPLATSVPGTSGSPQQGPPGPSGAPSASGQASTGDPIADALAKNYAALGVQPTGPGTGPTDLAYFADKVKATGGLTPQNSSYWFGPNGRIAQELAKAKTGAPTSAAPVAARMPYQAPASSLLTPTAPLTPALQMPSPYARY